ncbi:MAG: carbohydrate binding family 9 domain-containing protein, partial [Planctomycetota bacterium]
MRLSWLLLLPMCVSTASGQEPAPAATPSGHVPLIAAEITLDGDFQEDAWSRALHLDHFTEVTPDEGQTADPPTRILVMRSATHLYLGFVCMEPEPETMVLQNLRRDAFLNEDDRMEFVFDTFHDEKTSYFFQISAAGSRGDALLGDNGRRFNKPWDGFWEGKTRILADRWVAEIAIPFSTLAVGPGDVWGANFERTRGKDRSNYRWSGARREIRVGNVSEAGELSGFAGIDQGLGLEFKPYLKMKRSDGQDGDSDILNDLGGEVNWRLTPQLTGSVTWNTDFAETEVDERRVNLSRFPLFFPEKRDFFLQDTTLFQFGERGRRSGGTNLLPFFSRRIGLLDGAEVPLDYGLRLAGRAGPWDIGFLGVHTGAEASAGAPESDLFVFRPSYNVSKSLAVGAIFTDGNPAGDLSNTVAGADLRWSSTSLLPGIFSLNSYFVHSDDEATAARGLGFGTEASLSTSYWDYTLSMLGTQGDFLPALGFVRRPGELRTTGSVFWNPRPESGPIRKYIFGISPLVWTDLDGEVISSRVRLGWVQLET